MAKVIFIKNQFTSGAMTAIAKDNVDISIKFPSHIYNIVDITDEEYDDIKYIRKEAIPQEDGSLIWQTHTLPYLNATNVLLAIEAIDSPNAHNDQFAPMLEQAKNTTYETKADGTPFEYPTTMRLPDIVQAKGIDWISEHEYFG
jgi:hypothetical protein